MTDFNTTDQIPLIAHRLERMQQRLLAMGYEYAGGDDTRWPLCPVLMVKNGRNLLIAPWPMVEPVAFGEFWNSFIGQHGDSGLLLIGLGKAPDYLATLHGMVAYVDAQTLQYQLRPATGGVLLPDALHETVVQHLLDPNDTDGTAGVDCLAALQARADTPFRTMSFQEVVTQTVGVRIPFLSYALIAVCVLVFLLQLAWPRGNTAAESMVAWGALFGPFLRLGEWWRLLTSGFLHADIMHLGFNMMAIYVFAAQLEQWQGRWRLAAIFFFSVILGGLVALFWHPQSLLVGASGGLFGLLGAMIALLVRHREDLPAEVRTGLTDWLKKILFLNVIISLLPGISLAAHAGGLLGGFLLGLIITRSPVRNTPFPQWGYPALAALVLATMAFAVLVVARIPLGG
ncbi:MAG: rhomboid family intramembrane serine protease [Armatimonadota bacterium]